MASIQNFYTGVSTVDGIQSLYNTDLVNQDLLNNINTRKGERLMDANYGSIIWDLLFELKSPTVVSEIQNDLTNIVNNDPRVNLVTLEIAEQQYGYTAFLTLYYVHTKTTGQLAIEFNQATTQAGQNNTGS